MISRVGNNNYNYNQNYVSPASRPGNRPTGRPSSTNQNFWNTPSIFATNPNGHTHTAHRTNGDNFQRQATVTNSSQSNVAYRSNSNLNDYHRLAARPVASNFQTYGTRSVGHSSRVNEVDDIDDVEKQDGINEADEIDEEDGVDRADKSDKNSQPIGQQELSDSDKKIVDAAMKGMPEGLRSVAIEHLAAMGVSSGTTNSTTDTKNTTTNADQGKIDKLTKFLKDYNEQFGAETDGEISKEEYLANVQKMFENSMQEKGMPVQSPDFFSTDNNDYAAIARASKDVRDAGYDPNSTNNSTGNPFAVGNTPGTGSTSNDNSGLTDYVMAHQNDSKYAGLTTSQKRDKLIEDYKSSSNY